MATHNKGFCSYLSIMQSKRILLFFFVFFLRGYENLISLMPITYPHHKFTAYNIFPKKNFKIGRFLKCSCKANLAVKNLLTSYSLVCLAETLPVWSHNNVFFKDPTKGLKDTGVCRFLQFYYTLINADFLIIINATTAYSNR